MRVVTSVLSAKIVAIVGEMSPNLKYRLPGPFGKFPLKSATATGNERRPKVNSEFLFARIIFDSNPPVRFHSRMIKGRVTKSNYAPPRGFGAA